jgi:hypothetical protein
LGTYLTDEQIEKAREELSLLYAMPYASDLVGTAWEQILADIKGGIWTGMRDNRARPDFYVPGEQGIHINYSVKIEGLRCSSGRSCATHFLGYHEDFIVARPKVDTLLLEDQTIGNLSADELGAKVLSYYNDQIVRRYQWHVISFLLRLDQRPKSCEFIYWEEKPPAFYSPDDYWWQDSGRATGSNRNINGYPNSVSRTASRLPRAKFKWTSGGKQFYVLYDIPENADVWGIDFVDLTLDEVRNALRKRLRAKQRILGRQSAT